MLDVGTIKKMQFSSKQQLLFFNEFRFNVVEVQDQQSYLFIQKFLRFIRPRNVEGAEKVRIGAPADGGYVMLDPGEKGVAYSFGVSRALPWDLAMAERGFEVFQYDGGVAAPPQSHPRMSFGSFYLEGTASPDSASKSLKEILAGNGHENADGLILRLDIEGAEWGFLASLVEDELARFKQIIVEFHGTAFDCNKLAVLEKLNRTHFPVHFHYDNQAEHLYFFKENSFIYNPTSCAVSYARRSDYASSPSADYYPTALDAPNTDKSPEFPIGFFDLLITATSAGKPESLPVAGVPEELYDSFTLRGTIPVMNEYFNDAHLEVTCNSAECYREAIAAFEGKTFSARRDEALPFYQALEDYPITGKKVLVIGLSRCNCVPMCLWKKAEHVWVVDYNPPVCEHEDITTMTPEELETSGLNFDCVLSFSALEHCGLGRYGDQLNPNGDLKMMALARERLAPKGLFLLGVPVGKDVLVWNTHRIYGPKRLPHLLRGWNLLDVYSASRKETLFGSPTGFYQQPLMVLRKSRAHLANRQDTARRCEYARKLIGKGLQKAPAGSKNPKMLLQFLESTLNYKPYEK